MPLDQLWDPSLSKANSALLGEEASVTSDVPSAQSGASMGQAPEHNTSPRCEVPSEGRLASPQSSEGIDPNDMVTCPNEFEDPIRTSRTIVLCTAFINGISNANPDWFSTVPDSEEIKQEEISGCVVTTLLILSSFCLLGAAQPHHHMCPPLCELLIVQ